MLKKIYLILCCASFSIATQAADAGGSVELVGERLKIQFSVESGESEGSFALREMLIKDGFQEDDGMVETKNALAPLEMYNYLYENGHFVFTIYIPVNEKLFASLDTKGFVFFEGPAAQKLFELVKRHVAKSDVSSVDLYKWSAHSYCHKTLEIPTIYRCMINR